MSSPKNACVGGYVVGGCSDINPVPLIFCSYETDVNWGFGLAATVSFPHVYNHLSSFSL